MATDLLFSGTPLAGPPWELVFGSGGVAAPATGFQVTRFGLPTVALRVDGFHSTQFGAPRLFPAHAVGFQTGNFGTPYAVFLQIPEPGGFFVTQFGTASNARMQPAQGWLATHFGAIVGRQHWDAPALALVTQFGTPSTPTDRTTGASGAARTAFGHPLSWRIQRRRGAWHQHGHTYGLRPSARFGTPTT